MLKLSAAFASWAGGSLSFRSGAMAGLIQWGQVEEHLLVGTMPSPGSS